MNKLKVLMSMQFKEKFNFKSGNKAFAFKAVRFLLLYSLVTLCSYLVFWLFRFLNLLSPLGYIPISFMALIFFICFLLSVFSNTIDLTKTLFFEKDNQVFLAYPINSSDIFFAKILLYFINELKRTFLLIVPIFFAYGLISNLPIYYFLLMPFFLGVFAFIPVLLGALLSIPTNFIILFLNRYSFFKKIFIVLLAIGGLVFFIWATKLIPSKINLILIWSEVSVFLRNFLHNFIEYFNIFYYVTICICGLKSGLEFNYFTSFSYIIPLTCVGIILGLFGLNYLVSRPIYSKIVARNFEFKKGNYNARKNYIINKKYSGAVYETIKHVRDNQLFASSVFMIFLCPGLILFLNKIYSAMNTSAFGNYLMISFNLLMLFIIIFAHNVVLASVFSREGLSVSYEKTVPVSFLYLVFSKIFYFIIVSFLTMIFSLSIFLKYIDVSIIEKIMISCFVAFVVLGELFWSVQFDVANPQNQRFQFGGYVGENENEIKAIILTFVLSSCLFGLVLFFLREGRPFVWLKLFVIGLTFFIVRLILLLKVSRVAKGSC